METLNGSANLMLVTDLDMTLVDHRDLKSQSLLRFNALWEAYYRRDSLLVFSTGRARVTYGWIRKSKPLLTPDILITSVGTEIAYGETMVNDDTWDAYLDYKWNIATVLEETDKFPQLKLQREESQRPHKVSFFMEKDNAVETMKALSERLDERGLDAKLVYSGGEALDVLPKRAGKGKALIYLLEKFKANGKTPVNTLVCGDSGNDADLFSVPEVHGVMVSNAMEELLQWHEENTKNNPKIFHATERCASGIIEAIGKFNLGPTVSPRDIRGLEKSEAGSFYSCNEALKFYIFYERWRLADVEKSEQSIQTLKSLFHPSSIFVHPSGVERPMTECIDDMFTVYGDMQGKKFCVWLDKVSSAQIGLDSCVVTFDKWEKLGDERHCRRTKLLFSSKADEFCWMHMHQEWLDGSKPDEEAHRLF